MEVYMKRGFTLAEVLVTLGIIGVVSAMTLPTLVKNHQRQVYVTQLQKVVNELSQAFESAMTDSNAVSLFESNVFTNGSARPFFNRYFKVTQTCAGNDLVNCFPEQYKNLNGETLRARDLINSGMDCATIASGASICTNLTSFCTDNACKEGMYVFTDINGKQGPNIVGRDFFHFFASYDGTIYGASEDYVDENLSYDAAWGDDYGFYLTKIMNDGWKMDY